MSVKQIFTWFCIIMATGILIGAVAMYFYNNDQIKEADFQVHDLLIQVDSSQAKLKRIAQDTAKSGNYIRDLEEVVSFQLTKLNTHEQVVVKIDSLRSLAANGKIISLRGFIAKARAERH